MARITHVKKAQPRYETKPVLDDNGKPIRIPLTKNGEPKLTKHGQPITITKTVRDLDRPLPPEVCDYPGCEVHPEKLILPGTPYKHMSPRSGPYGGRKLTRHEECPGWNSWEYSSSTSASVARIQHEGAELIDGAELDTADDFDSLRDDLTALASELRDEKQENLDNLPESFQYSGDLYEQVEALGSWVDGIESADAPDFPEADTTCQACGGNGQDDCSACDGEGSNECTRCGGGGVGPKGECDNCGGTGTTDCEECTGTGEVDCEECGGTGETNEDDSPSDADLEEWRGEARQALQDALDDCDV